MASALVGHGRIQHPLSRKSLSAAVRGVRESSDRSLPTPQGPQRPRPSTSQAAWLEALAAELDKTHPGAAAKLSEGMPETLAVLRLGVPPTLAPEVARAHARSGEPLVIAGCLGFQDGFDPAAGRIAVSRSI